MDRPWWANRGRLTTENILFVACVFLSIGFIYYATASRQLRTDLSEVCATLRAAIDARKLDATALVDQLARCSDAGVLQKGS
jgi:hypothetical protein